MNTHIGNEIFQDIPRRVAKFRENRPRDVKKSVVGKKIKHGKNNSLLLERYAGDCNNARCKPTATDSQC